VIFYHKNATRFTINDSNTTVTGDLNVTGSLLGAANVAKLASTNNFAASQNVAGSVFVTHGNGLGDQGGSDAWVVGSGGGFGEISGYVSGNLAIRFTPSTTQMTIGGVLKSISVDGSGFVKAA
jgi:hypothetical protein